ncbi:MAG: DUF202 domain-containing protein [Syntrophaceae bacterium]|nr:DUF202 domain-containing protein [Syntrophaceae bacterium]
MNLFQRLLHKSYFRGMEPKAPDIASDDRIFLAWQRTHMANERTFLSWSRTSISLLAFGFVIEKFDLFMKHLILLSGGHVEHAHGISTTCLSLFCFALAGIMIVVSGVRFIMVRRHINGGEATFSILPDMLVIVSVIIIIVITLWLSFNRLFNTV